MGEVKHGCQTPDAACFQVWRRVTRFEKVVPVAVTFLPQGRRRAADEGAHPINHVQHTRPPMIGA